ncbi:ATP-grasp domain-containing protein [Maridesulfovibrio salexigens]|uniref:PylC N-terminal domain-containing protein n=1 Tax=Maridesulfovibrio salexigens (strain ATCC 14822 / DSM 2638 / NCIMB 8403 / VKM B-1763) TaxID=526222 RepID=C6BTK1_MARSD|nr:ATP-grasp domain-containing protein [Maridesulfovibrio salexigens]ACS81682.1 protein of unknown function DUF201 [Maridesulfovibrio salexigens DSM 2638]
MNSKRFSVAHEIITVPVGNVLVTSVSRKAPLVQAMKTALKRISKEAQVIAGDIDPDAPAQHVADAFWIMPRLTSKVLPDLIQGCRERGISVILPSRDGELPFWAHHRKKFAEAGIAILVSEEKSVNLCLDKLEFAKFGKTAHLSVINAAKKPGHVGTGPYVVKERFGAGSKKIGLSLSLDEALAHAKTLKNPIYQPHITGPEISIDGWVNQHGVVIGVVLRRRDRIIAGESQVTTTFRDEKLEREASLILKQYNLRGPVVMQAIISNNTMHMIECNPRFGGASTTSIAAGLDSLYWSLIEVFGQDKPTVFKRTADNVKQVRLPVDMVFYDTDI